MTVHTIEGDWGSGKVSELGACVLSWAPAGAEKLLTPDPEQLIAGSMWHGGIPVCAPWFGAGQGDWTPPFGHGLVSRVQWRTTRINTLPDSAQLILETTATDHAHLPGSERYPSDLGYQLEVTMSAQELVVALTISSPTEQLVTDHALHPYWRVDAASSVLAGLDGVAYLNAAHDWQPGVQAGDLKLGRHLDLVFNDARPTALADNDSELKITAKGASSMVVWHPGKDERIPAWPHFVCVEYGNVRQQAVTIPAGGSHRLELRATV